MNQSLLSVENLDVTFHTNTGKMHAVKNISFSLNKGETLAIVGESGSGKSVTAMSIIKLLPGNVTHYSKDSQVNYAGDNLLHKSEKFLRDVRGNKIAFIFQEPMTSLNPYMKIGKQLAEAIIEHKNIDKAEAYKRVIEMLILVGIKDPEKRVQTYPHEFSGGQLQRIMIAMALLNEPDILIADEPTTALDVTIQAEILDLIHELQKKMGMAIIFITHDLGLAKHYSDRVCVMKLGEIIERGDINEIFDNPQHPYTIKLLNATPKGLKTPIPDDSETIITANNIEVNFPIKYNFFGKPTAYFQAVKNISLSIKSGETLGVVGESGSGKSTLGKAILQMVKHSGDVHFGGHQLEKYHANSLKADLQIVFQDPFGSLSPRMTIGEIIGEGLHVHQPELSKKERMERVRDMLEEVELDPNMINRYPHEFSGGQRQRIAIARAVILHPKFILLDEPTSALDRSIQVTVVELLRNLQKKYHLSYMFISHDLSVVRAMSDRVLVMKQGDIVESGTARQIFENPQTEYCKSLIAAAFDL
ncbi:MAG: ABC transporter ATP-binding protein [Gammaproteobacteria bacterium]|nr:ABC transporter ATP-binding protein [Gammaproteobacteria bacterium]